ncbi:fumarylacetoacetate hydrolase family protein [Propionibacterium freudenreichii]|uniref:fumarylacetoacetate hydrolase family protein n=1 Tax=Propionibacterium freudenreichii TaxID=1744 RepID=UPI00254BDA68|nr:fumarylacetoacetate hydrolase family protein [Propionibacterium freudenreichii]MDK9673071.1 fumarylacetoacetate hydrolase family protein [Propionibacterium freudenreichii]
MRIARYASPGTDPAYGLVELVDDGGDHPDTVATLTGDPLAGPVNLTGERHPLAEVRLLAPVIPRSKIVGVGRNYAAHAAELGNTVDANPSVFLKPNTSVIGPDDPIIKPVETDDLQFEGELAVVIGRICRLVPVDRVAEVIFGYTVANDVTARDVQKTDKQWTRAKGWDSFCPLGPWIVSHLSLDEAAALDVTTTLDGEVKQHGSTADMVHSIPELVSYISGFTTLLPGDVILTGTPAGVARMVPGQRVSIEIGSIGALSNPIVDGAQTLGYGDEESPAGQ